MSNPRTIAAIVFGIPAAMLAGAYALTWLKKLAIAVIDELGKE